MLLKLFIFTLFVVMITVQSVSCCAVNLHKFICFFSLFFRYEYFVNYSKFNVLRENKFFNLRFFAVISFCLLMISTSSVQANEDTEAITCNTNMETVCPTYSRWFVGGQLGYSKSEVSQSDINQGFVDIGATVTSLSVDDSDMAYELFAGYQFNPTWALQLGYLDLGSRGIEFEGETPDPDAFFDVVEHIYPDSGKGVKLAVIGSFPINDSWKVSARLSLFNWSQTYNTNSVSGSGDDEISGTDLLLGAEVSYEVNRDIELYLSYERFSAEHHAANNIGLGIRYFFDDIKPLPKFIPHTHNQTVVRQPVPATLTTDQIISSKLALPANISIYYQYAKSDLDEDDLNKLAKVKTILDVRDDLDISIHGYSSALGDEQRNLKLSLLRASGVEQQLNLAGIVSSRMDVNFHGYKDQPATLKGQRVEIKFEHNDHIKLLPKTVTKVKTKALPTPLLPSTVVTDPSITSSLALPVSMSIYYPYAKSDFDKANLNKLAKVKAILDVRDDLDISIHGYSSSIGDKQRNLRLSFLRANGVEEQLYLAGIVSSRMDVNFHGYEDQPATLKGQRVEIKFVSSVSSESSEVRQEVTKLDIESEPIGKVKPKIVADISTPTLDETVNSINTVKAALPDNVSIYYPYGKFIIDEDNLAALAKINKIIDALDGRDDVDVVIHGYASAIGNKERNRRLSKWRAHAVQKQLYLGGIMLSRTEVVSHGDKEQSDSPKDQRVEIKFKWHTAQESHGVESEKIKLATILESITETDIAQELTERHANDSITGNLVLASGTILGDDILKSNFAPAVQVRTKASMPYIRPYTIPRPIGMVKPEFSGNSSVYSAMELFSQAEIT